MTRLILPLIFCLGCAVLARAGEIGSAYTTFDLKACEMVSEPSQAEEWGGAYLCPGHGGMEVYFATGDLREMFAYGHHPEDHCAGSQTFGPFNAAMDTIEWRLDGGTSFAAIQRRSLSDPEDPDRQTTWLAVTRIEAKNSCRVATVEGAMPRANERAREAADTLARHFDCARDEARVISRDPSNGVGGTSGSPCAGD